MAHLLGAESIALEYPTRHIFDGLTLGLQDGDRIGVVGRNGDGKSTLLRLLAGRQDPDAGQITRRGGVTLGMLDQADVLDDDETVGHAIVGERAEHEWAGDASVREVIAGLAADLPWDARLGELSGGQRRRVALAALLTREWDVILLDEPTNHLDLEGVDWLARHLVRRWPSGRGALVVVTHDRWFLDAVSQTTWEVHDGVVEPFEGGYAAYVLQRVERDRQAAAIESRRRNLMRKELAWLRRGAPARTSKPKFRMDAAAELIANEPPVRDRVELTKLATARLGKDVVDLIDAGVTFGALRSEPSERREVVGSTAVAEQELATREGGAAPREVLRDVTWRIAPGERTGILGVNGAGKSTLLGLAAGTIAPTSGRVKQGKTVRIAVLDQRLTGLDELGRDRVADVIGRQKTAYRAGDVELTPGQLLERLGFTNAQLSTPVADLSGGQKRRLQLLLILLDEPNVLILDEPTNDLDTDMLAAMEDLLDSWPGTLLVVSHDRYLLERVTDQQYAVLAGADGVGRLRHLPGGVEEYLRLRARADVSGAGSAPAGSAAPSASASGPATELSGSERRTLEKELAALERRIAKLGDDIARRDAAMAEHDPSDYAGLGEAAAAAREVREELEAAEDRWLEVSAALEG